jgi:hypothetical protein
MNFQDNTYSHFRRDSFGRRFEIVTGCVMKEGQEFWWSAVYASDEHDDDGEWTGPVGGGYTEQDAMDDLINENHKMADALKARVAAREQKGSQQ